MSSVPGEYSVNSPRSSIILTVNSVPIAKTFCYWTKQTVKESFPSHPKSLLFFEMNLERNN